jgi:hypothetical protein
MRGDGEAADLLVSNPNHQPVLGGLTLDDGGSEDEEEELKNLSQQS